MYRSEGKPILQQHGGNIVILSQNMKVLSGKQTMIMITDRFNIIIIDVTSFFKCFLSIVTEN